MRVALDGSLCQGHGRCYEIASRVFTSDDRGHCELLQAEVPGEDAELATEAVRACPEQAIRVENGGS